MLSLLAMAILSGSAGQWPSHEYAFKELEFGNTDSSHEKGIWVFRDADSYRKYLRTLGDKHQISPQIDWRVNQVVAIHAGPAPTTGYALHLKRLAKKPFGAEAEIDLQRPTGVAGQMITYPYVIVKTERFPGTVKLAVVPG